MKLEGTNIKLASVVSDITGKSARAMLDALADGQTAQAELAELGHPRLKATTEELNAAIVLRPIVRHPHPDVS